MSQCRKKGELKGAVSFSQEDKQIIPYHIGDTFTLVDSLGSDSLTFTTNTVMSEYATCAEVDLSEHQLDAEYYDWYEIEHVSMYASGRLSIDLYFSCPYYGAIIKFMRFQLDISSHPEIPEFWGICTFYDGTLSPAGVSYVSPEINLQVTYFDTLNLCNRQFYAAYCLSTNNQAGEPELHITEVYYSIEQGLVGIKASDGRIWSLIP